MASAETSLHASKFRQYTDTSLKDIGALCKNRLPPATAVQAMFLYEMQRETELEKLFHGLMFQLAKSEDQSYAYGNRLGKIEMNMTALQKQVAWKSLEERLSASKVRTDALLAKLNTYTKRLDDQGERLVRVEEKTKPINPTGSALQISLAASPQDASSSSQQLDTLTTAFSALQSDLSTFNSDIEILFDERDALASLLQTANERIDKLEDLVRALTRQMSSSNPSSGSGSPPLGSTQLLPVQTVGGQVVELCVPKGKPLVPHKRDVSGVSQ